MAYSKRELLAASRANRLADMGLLVDGVPFDLGRYPWAIDLLNEAHPNVVIRKGAQLGFTITMILRTIDMSLYDYPRGVLYLMPSRDDVADFSKTRFNRFLKENADTLGKIVSGTDSVNVKRIGNAFIYFRGARSRSQLKSIPVDALYTDEEDEMDPAQVDLAEHRLDGSSFKHHFRLSTPTIPDFGVDYHWNRSDKRHWKIKCDACGGWTCLELDFPECLKRNKDGDVFRACGKCDKELNVRRGEWVAELDGVGSTRGYWISQLSSPTVELRKQLDMWESGELTGDRLKEYMNSVLGMPYADIEDLLDDRTLREHTRDEPREYSDEGPCIMGADIGKSHHHYMVGRRSGERKIDVLDFGEGDFAKLADKIKRFNVTVACFDMMAEMHAVRAFQEAHGQTWGVIYSEAQRNAYDWNGKEMRVTVNRTELLDESHRTIIQGEASFPRPQDDWGKWSKQMCNLARTVVRDPNTGTPKVRWIVRGRKNDHYRHTWGYLVLAAQMAPISRRVRRIITPAEHSRGKRSWMSV